MKLRCTTEYIASNSDLKTRIAIRLPEAKPFKARLGHENAWSEHYGALHVAAKYCGIRKPATPFPGVWQHGCFAPWMDLDPKLLVYHAPGSERRPVFVARKDQEQFLRESGYAKAVAIGLPYVYLPAVTAPRIKNSVLVVPMHTLAGNSIESHREMEEYAELLASVTDCFDVVLACVHPSCVANGNWTQQFEKHRIRWVTGASTTDANALLRMKMLFEQFEYVTTNSWGSHVAYTLAAGCKVSIYGAAPSLTRDMIMKDPGWGGNEGLYTKAFSDEYQSRKYDSLKRFNVAPIEGIYDPAYGNLLIGNDHKLTKERLKELFEWSFPNRLYHRVRHGLRKTRSAMNGGLRNAMRRL